MEEPRGMEQMLIGCAYYQVRDFGKIRSLLLKLGEGNFFNVEEDDEKNMAISGAVLQPYPKNHWNPFSKLPGAMQVAGGVSVTKDGMTVDAKTRSRLAGIRELLEAELSDAIVFERDEFTDPLEEFRKKGKG